jgi:hypothetical protein
MLGSDWLVRLLEYGFHGLSVLMLVLAFVLFRAVIAEHELNETKAQAAKFYLLGAFAFMVVAGSLELLETYLNPAASGQVDIVLKATPWFEGDAERYGVIRIIQKTEQTPLMHTTGNLVRVGPDSELSVDISELIGLIDRSAQTSETAQPSVKGQGTAAGAAVP